MKILFGRKIGGLLRSLHTTAEATNFARPLRLCTISTSTLHGYLSKYALYRVLWLLQPHFWAKFKRAEITLCHVYRHQAINPPKDVVYIYLRRNHKEQWHKGWEDANSISQKTLCCLPLAWLSLCTSAYIMYHFYISPSPHYYCHCLSLIPNTASRTSIKIGGRDYLRADQDSKDQKKTNASKESK